MTTAPPRRRHARPGDIVARVAVIVGLAAGVGLVLAGSGNGARWLADSAPCQVQQAGEPIAIL